MTSNRRTVTFKKMVLGIALIAAPLSAAADEEPTRSSRGDRFHRVSERQRDPDSHSAMEIGFLFVDGEFVSPPYRVEQSNDDVTVNGRVVGQVPRFRRGWGRRRGEGSRQRRNGWGARWYAEQLEGDCLVVVFSGRPIVIDEKEELFRVLLQPRPREKAVAEFFEVSIPDHFERPALRQWMQTYDPPAAVAKRMREVVESYDEMIAGQSKPNSVSLLSSVAYPMTIVGMILAVLAMGHLLHARPQSNSTEAEAVITPEAIRGAVICLGLIVALSALDLAWTILASQAGQMTELNPVGSRLIEDPLALTAFKATFTFLGAGLLFALRRHSSARLASWWLCMVMTLVTFRWLVFQSMMVG